MNRELLAQPILTPADLHRYWQELMSPLGFTQRRLYVAFVDFDRCVVPELHEISELPVRPSPDGADALMGMLDHYRDGCSVAMLLTRPGRHSMDADDRAWALELAASGRRCGVPLEPIHLATDSRLVPFAGDDDGDSA